MITTSNSLFGERDAQSSGRRATSRHVRFRAFPRSNRTRPTANNPNRFATSSTTEHRAFWPSPPWQCFSLRFLALQLIACYAPGRINSSIDLLGSGSVHVSGPVAATFPSTPLISNNVGPVKLFLSTLLFSLKRVFLFRFLSALHRRPRLVRNLAGGFSPTQTSLRSKLRP